jgi:hypothetical protein
MVPGKWKDVWARCMQHLPGSYDKDENHPALLIMDEPKTESQLTFESIQTIRTTDIRN